MIFDENFAHRQRISWAHPPVDDVGYMSTAWMLTQSDDTIRQIVDQMIITRYQGARNHENKWREFMGLDSIHGKFVTDFGCGTGIESLELARAGNHVTLADIAPENVKVAERIFHLYGYSPVESIVVDMKAPYLPDHKMDVFFSCGVIHHIPWADEIMQRAYDILPPGGEARLMLYSDEGWRVIVGTEPPPEKTHRDPGFGKFVYAYDQVGEYADWYNPDKILSHFKGFSIERWSYLRPDNSYMAAVLRKD